MKSSMKRFQQRRGQYNKVLSLLSAQSGRSDFEPLEVAGVVQIFAITFELAWKMLKDLLEAKDGVIAPSPRSAIKEAFVVGYIDEGHPWMDMLDARNEIAHVYDEERINELMGEILNNYLKPLAKLGGEMQCMD